MFSKFSLSVVAASCGLICNSISAQDVQFDFNKMSIGGFVKTTVVEPVNAKNPSHALLTEKSRIIEDLAFSVVASSEFLRSRVGVTNTPKPEVAVVAGLSKPLGTLDVTIPVNAARKTLPQPAPANLLKLKETPQFSFNKSYAFAN